MDGVIFIRTLTERQEEILEKVKTKKDISASTKAIQYIITEYGRMEEAEKGYQSKIRNLEEKLFEYEEFFNLLNRINSKRD